MNDNKPHPKWKGELAEHAIAYELFKRKIPISKPLGDNQRYDLIIDIDGTLYRCQCKCGRLKKNGKVIFATCSVRINKNGYFISGYKKQIDMFIVWCPDLPTNLFMIPIDKATNWNMTIDDGFAF